MEQSPDADKSALTSADFPLRVRMGRGLSFTLEWNDYAVLRDQKKEFTERCFGLAISGGPLPGSHCSVIAILYPGDLLKAEGQVCRTKIRHIDPHTGKGKHRDEAVRVLKLFRTAVLAELGRPGRKWDGAPPSQAVVEERLADCDDPIRDKVPGTVSDGHVGTGMLAATSFGWVAKQIDLLTGDKARSAVSIENIKAKGLKSLRDSMVEYICNRVAEKRSAAPTSGAGGPADGAIDDDGAEIRTAPQSAAAAQHQVDLPVSGGGDAASGAGGGGGDAAAGRGRKEEDSESSDSDSETESEGEEEDDYELEYADGTVVAVGSADENNEEAEDGDAGNATTSADGGKEEVGVEATKEEGQEQAASEGGKVSVDAGEAANNTGMQETEEASGRQGPEQVDVEELRRENLMLRAENARLAALLGEEQARPDRFFAGLRGLVDHLKELAVQVEDTDKFAAQQLLNATEDLSKTITGNITGSFDEAWKTMKTFAEQASAWLEDFDNPEGRVACARALVVDALADHVNGVVGEARRALELYITTQLSAAQVNIATASFVASGMKMLTETIGTVAPGRRGSSPSANDAEQAQRRAVKQVHKRTGDGDDKESSKRSKGSDGSCGSKPPAQSVAAGEKGVSDKEVPSAQAAEDGGAGTTKGPSVAVAAEGNAKAASATVAGTSKPKAASATVAGTSKLKAASATIAGTSKSKAASATVAGTTNPIPRNPPAATAAPAGQSGCFAKGDAPASAKGPPGGNALRQLLHAMESHRRDVQQHPVVDAGLSETASRTVTPKVVGTPLGAPPAAPTVAAQPNADPKSAFLRAHLGARKAAAPPRPEPGKSATPTAVNATDPTPSASVVDVVAEKGVSAALATGGREDKHAGLAAVLAHFEAARRPEHAPALAIMDTAHAAPSGIHGGGLAEPTAATGAVADGNAGRKGKDDTGKGKAVSQRSTRAMSAGKEKPARNKDKTGGKGKPAKKKAKAEEEKEEEEAEEEEEEEESEEEEEEHGRRGHGIRRDRSGDGQGWMELAYEHAIAYFVYDGYVSKVLMKELTALKPGELDEWKAVWEEVKILPTGMWTVMWARGLCHPRARFDDILGRFRGYAGSGDALHGVLWPAMWFPIIEDTEEGRAETNANLPAMVNRVSMCAAYGKVAARVAFEKVDASAEGNAGEKTEMEGAEGKADEKEEMGAQALAASACALWCFMSTPASVLGAVGEGKAAAMVAGAGKERGEHFAKVIHAVIDFARNRQAPAGEVAHNVAPELQRYGVARAFEAGIEEVEADMIARATVETLAFWGMCPLDGPKLKAEGIDVPCDAKMEYDLEHMGRKGEKVKQAKGSKRKRVKAGKQAKDSTDA
ncbi:unnamed protein product [Closterium sp. Yama58-4]|nr:unnamed protein product [Closterium sp. Yama58-4]